MIALSNKSKQYGSIALKVLILSIAFVYIYKKITADETIPLLDFIDTVQSKNKWFIILFLGFAIGNWILEILKWKTVVSAIKKISFREATRQSLTSLTISLATPNRIGEYGAKAYFFKSKHRKKILLLNLFSSLWQMLVTSVLGITGLVYIAKKYSLSLSPLKIVISIVLFFIVLIFGYFFKEKELIVKGLSITKVINYFKNMPRYIQIKIGVLSALRYLIFSSLFIIILFFFGAKISLQDAIFLVFAMYVLSSIVPSVFIFDTVVKGGVAVGLFSLVGVSQWIVLCTVLSMWILNFGLPAICGSFYVIAHKSK